MEYSKQNLTGELAAPSNVSEVPVMTPLDTEPRRLKNIISKQELVSEH